MSGDQVVTVCKAEPGYPGDTVPGRCIDITEPMPAFDRTTYLADARAFHHRQAELIHGALIASLPGGTLDHLFAVMAADRASILRVPRPVAEPADDDVVDAEIDYSEAWTELAGMRLAVLAIHKPCHNSATEPWECGRHSDPEHDGYYRLPPVCVDCVDGDENAVPYPCPTAQALEVTADA